MKKLTTSRRDFTKLTGISIASFLAPVSGLTRGWNNLSLFGGTDDKSKVAAARAVNYDRAFIRQKVGTSSNHWVESTIS